MIASPRRLLVTCRLSAPLSRRSDLQRSRVRRDGFRIALELSLEAADVVEDGRGFNRVALAERRAHGKRPFKGRPCLSEITELPDRPTERQRRFRRLGRRRPKRGVDRNRFLAQVHRLLVQPQRVVDVADGRQEVDLGARLVLQFRLDAPRRAVQQIAQRRGGAGVGIGRAEEAGHEGRHLLRGRGLVARACLCDPCNPRLVEIRPHSGGGCDDE